MSPLLAYMGLSAPSAPGSSLPKGEGALGLGHTGCAVGVTFLYVCLALLLCDQGLSSPIRQSLRTWPHKREPRALRSCGMFLLVPVAVLLRWPPCRQLACDIQAWLELQPDGPA